MNQAVAVTPVRPKRWISLPLGIWIPVVIGGFILAVFAGKYLGNERTRLA